MPMDRLDDLFLLGSIYADGLERLSGAAVWADEGLVLLFMANRVPFGFVWATQPEHGPLFCAIRKIARRHCCRAVAR